MYHSKWTNIHNLHINLHKTKKKKRVLFEFVFFRRLKNDKLEKVIITKIKYLYWVIHKIILNEFITTKNGKINNSNVIGHCEPLHIYFFFSINDIKFCVH